MSSTGVDRRRFLALAGASLALARMTGCTRGPAEKIVPYVEQPDLLADRTALRFATSMVERGYATGLLAESRLGRPVKIEGNPRHPASLGAAGPTAQAWLWSLCDPDRIQTVTRLGRITPWSAAAQDLARLVAEQGASAGGAAPVRVLTGTVTSPTLAAEIAALLAERPGVRWHRFEPCGLHHTRAGVVLAFGAPLEVLYDFTSADVIVALDSDFAAEGPGNLRYARDFARRRAPGEESAIGHTSAVLDTALLPPSPSMNRLYSVESSPTCTGTLADHRLALSPTAVALFAAALAAELGVAPAIAAPPPVARFAAAAAADLRRAGRRALVVAGEPASPDVHVLAAAMNAALGSAGTTVFHTDPVEASPVDHVSSIRELCEDMHAGAVSVLVILGGDPVYTAPADLDFARALRRVGTRVLLASGPNGTAPHCHFVLPEAHGLEVWGDSRAHDGTVTLAQPLIAPLTQGRSALGVVRALRGRPLTPDLDVLRAFWRDALGAADLDQLWSHAVSLGFFPGSESRARTATLVPGAAEVASRRIAGVPRGGYELAFRPDPFLLDGRHAGNAWLQELPRPHTTLTWDNAALVSPRTAAELGVATEEVIEIGRAGRALRAPVLIVEGHPDDTLTVHLGYGQKTTHGVAAGVGFDAYPIRTTDALWHLSGVLVRRTRERHALACTQKHMGLHGRENARVATLADLTAHPGLVHEMGHEPPRSLSMYPEWVHDGPAWGMTIDQNICTGCSACVMACQAENNGPVVGKEGVLAGREMHWLRVDRYVIPAASGLVIVHQPMMCVHCEKAPCEYVCPVEATSHSADGLNEMTYNRCVGTRYCQNNCPYKVRRFNFFDYQGNSPDALRIVRNPEVTVRSRGVMEKCTYCVQRIRRAGIEDRVAGQQLATPVLMTACQQSCPTGAITFGDLHDAGSRVRRLKGAPRAYHVLAALGTRPRTSHLARLRNPNPELPDHG